MTPSPWNSQAESDRSREATFLNRMPRRYSNLDPAHQPPGPLDVFRWGVWQRITRRRKVSPPGEPAEQIPPDLERIRDAGDEPRLTWIGHSSFLLTLASRQLLIDPVFSPRIGMFYKRHVDPGLLPEHLPSIDAVLVSHNHYDHLDEPSISAVRRDVPVIVPRGLGRWFCRRRFSDVRELDWWDATEVAEVTITAVPARHWSRRSFADGNRSHWCGFVASAKNATVYHAGDSAWFDGFAEIGRRFPVLDAALLPVGGYEPAWFMDRNHMNPEQAGGAFLALNARRLIPMHWGTFQMTDEPLTEPLHRIRAWSIENLPGKLQLVVPRIGETVAVGQHNG